jgi:Zn-dependent protease
VTPLLALALHPLEVVYFAIAVGVALVVHEWAHAAIATRLGDRSPKAMGRLTLNPRPHIDPFGSLVLPLILLLPVLFRGSWIVFAYAKPMPLNPFTLRRRSRDTVLIQAAGPVANLILAMGFGVLLALMCGTRGLQDLLAALVQVNVFFAAIHVIPMPPLDGARAIAPFLSPRVQETMANLEQYAPLFILAAFFILGSIFLNFAATIAGGLIQLVPGASCGRVF